MDAYVQFPRHALRTSHFDCMRPVDMLEVDHMTFTNFMGDGVALDSGLRDWRPHGGYNNLAVANLEQGAFLERGEKVVSDKKRGPGDPGGSLQERLDA
jgi:hypothetical protein